MKKAICISVISAAAIWLAGCASSTEPGGSNDLTANWSYSATSVVTSNTTAGTAALTQSGSNVTGTLTCTSNPAGCPSAAGVTGTVSGAIVTLTISYTCGGTPYPLTATGTIASPGTTMSGTYNQPAAGSCAADAGNWSATD